MRRLPLTNLTGNTELKEPDSVSTQKKASRRCEKLSCTPHLCLLTHRLDLEALHVFLLWLGLVWLRKH